MTLFHKRLLVFFSVALNIGFVIMAVVMVLNHPKSHHGRTSREVLRIVERLDLAATQKESVIKEITGFKSQMGDHDRDLKKARLDIIRLLAKDGPLDSERLHQLFTVAMDRERQKSDAFETHVVTLRRQLGDEKGARFFTRLLAHLESKADDAKR